LRCADTVAAHGAGATVDGNKSLGRRHLTVPL